MQELTQSDTFNIQQFSYFLDRLSEVQDADGPLLDSTMALYGSGMAFGHSHGNANLPIILAGGGELGLKHGRHIDFNAAVETRRLHLRPRQPRPALRHLPQSGEQQGPPEQPAADHGSENGRAHREVRRQQRRRLGGAGRDVIDSRRLVGHCSCVSHVRLGTCLRRLRCCIAQLHQRPASRASPHVASQPGQVSSAEHRHLSRRRTGDRRPGQSPRRLAAGWQRPGDRYHAGPLHYFAMLPYGMISYQRRAGRTARYSARHARAWLLLSCRRRARKPRFRRCRRTWSGIRSSTTTPSRWKTISASTSVAARHGKWCRSMLIKGKLNVAPTGEMAKDGINTPYTFDIDDVTRVWKGRTLVDLADIAPEQVVQFNLGWSPGWRDKEFTVAEIWLDDESRKFATELQRRRHVRYQKQRWLPGWIDHVEAQRFRRRDRHAHAVRRHGSVAVCRTESDSGKGLRRGRCREDAAHLVPPRRQENRPGARVERNREPAARQQRHSDSPEVHGTAGRLSARERAFA